LQYLFNDNCGFHEKNADAVGIGWISSISSSRRTGLASEFIKDLCGGHRFRCQHNRVAALLQDGEMPLSPPIRFRLGENLLGRLHLYLGSISRLFPSQWPLAPY